MASPAKSNRAVRYDPSAATAPSGKPAQILSAAREVFMREGYGAAATDQIQQAAGVSKSTLYAHYRSKQAMFAAVVEAECAAFEQALTAVDFEHPRPEAALAVLGETYLRLLLSPSALALYRLVLAEAPRFPALGRTFFEAGPALVQRRLADYLARPALAGRLAIAAPDAAAECFLSVLRGTLQQRALLGIGRPPGRAAIGQAVALAVGCVLGSAAGRGRTTQAPDRD